MQRLGTLYTSVLMFAATGPTAVHIGSILLTTGMISCSDNMRLRVSVLHLSKTSYSRMLDTPLSEHGNGDLLNDGTP